jgi:hypothetical protein
MFYNTVPQQICIVDAHGRFLTAVTALEQGAGHAVPVNQVVFVRSTHYVYCEASEQSYIRNNAMNYPRDIRGKNSPESAGIFLDPVKSTVIPTIYDW